ncbi:MAG: type II secretion system protein GspM [Arhodomonas sp.]|nr:type II secretion system protein GspM [Arhodomonas sp.]
MEGIVDRHGGSIDSVQVMGPVQEDHYLRLRVRAELHADSGELAGILEDLETGRPVVIVDRMTINPEEVRRRRGGEPSGRLKIRLELNGFMAQRPPK